MRQACVIVHVTGGPIVSVYSMDVMVPGSRSDRARRWDVGVPSWIRSRVVHKSALYPHGPLIVWALECRGVFLLSRELLVWPL